MGFLGKLTKTCLDIAELPLDLTVDIITLGGAVQGKTKPYTVKKVQKIFDDYEEMKESLDD